MSTYTEYYGKIAFKTEADAEKARQELLSQKWLGTKKGSDGAESWLGKDDFIRLYWLDDGMFVRSEDQYTPSRGKTIYFNGGVMRNLHYLVDSLLVPSNDAIDRENTVMRAFSDDGQISFEEYSSDEGRMINVSAEDAIGKSEDELLAELNKIEVNNEALELCYDWVCDIEMDMPNLPEYKEAV